MDELIQNLDQQLAEAEMLESMFCNPGEFELDDELAVTECRNWLQDASNSKDLLPPTRIAFSLRLNQVNGDDELAVSVSLPHEYPSRKKPEFFVKSQHSLNRGTQSRINTDLGKFVAESVSAGEVSVLEVVGWLQEHGQHYIDQSRAEEEGKKSSKAKKAELEVEEPNSVRFWLYSHHLYSKTKRKNIVDLAKDSRLTGFSLPGKPGIICLEGAEPEVNQVWSVIKSWNWKKIFVRFQENFEGKVGLFSIFEEIGFVKGDTRDYHMDMGEFNKYLEKHNCDKNVFNTLFGISPLQQT